MKLTETFTDEKGEVVFEADPELIRTLRYVVKPYIDKNSREIKFSIEMQSLEKLDSGKSAWVRGFDVADVLDPIVIGEKIKDSVSMMAFV